MSDTKVDYDVVSEIAGHQPNKGVELVKAAEDIFKKVKEKAMQCAIKGEFISFGTINELQAKLKTAAKEGFSIRVYDQVVGG